MAVQVPLAGSYSSALAETGKAPPATRTMPFWSNVAVWTSSFDLHVRSRDARVNEMTAVTRRCRPRLRLDPACVC